MKLLPDHINHYVETLARSGLSQATIDRKLSSIRKFHEWAGQKGYLEPIQTDTIVITPTAAPTPANKRKAVFLAAAGAALIVALMLLNRQAQVFRLIFNFAKQPEGQVTILPPSKPSPTPIGSGPAGGAIVASPAEPWVVFFKGKVTGLPGTRSDSGSLQFSLYQEPTGGTPIWTSKVWQLTPNEKNEFVARLGDTSQKDSPIPQDVFFQHEYLYLGVRYAPGSTDPKAAAESTPRMKVSSAAHAADAAALQGHEPSEAAAAGQIPVIDPTGALVLASQTPSLIATAGTFKIEGQAVTLKTAAFSNGNITLAPDGEGHINLNTSASSGNQIAAQNANITTGSLYYGAVGNDATGYNLIELVSGSTPTTRFKVDALGNTYIGGTLTMEQLAVAALSSGTSSPIKFNSSILFPQHATASATGDFTLSPTGVLNITSTIANPGSNNQGRVYIEDTTQIGGHLYTRGLDAEGTVQLNRDVYVRQGLGINRPSTSLTSGYVLDVVGNATVSGDLRAGGQLQPGRFASAPSAVGPGSLYYNSGDTSLYLYNGTSWIAVAGGAVSGFWQRNSGVLSPYTITDDLTLGGTASSSSTFHVVSGSGNVTTAGTITLPNSNTLTGVANYLRLSNGLSVGGADTYYFDSSGNVNANAGTFAGALLANGDVTLGNAITDNITFTGRVAQDSDLIPIGTTGTNDLGSSALPWDNVYGVTLYQNGNSVCDITGNCSAATDIWSQANGALFPKNATVDLLVGGTATSSAKFALMNVNTGTPTASISGTTANVATYLTGEGTLSTTNMAPLTIGSSSTGPLQFYSTSNTLTSAGNLTLAGDIAVNGGDITTTSTGTATVFNTNATTLNIGGAATTLSLGASTGTTTVNNALTVTGTTTTNGTLTVNSDTITLGNATTDAMTFTARVAQDSDLIPITTTGTSDLGSASSPWDNLYVDNIYSTGNYNGFWQRFSGVLSPVNITDDLAIGGTATASAKFQVISGSGNVTTAGTITLPNSNTLTGVANYLRLSNGLSVGGADTYYFDSSGNVNANAGTFAGALLANGDVTLGNAITDNITFTGRVAQDSDLIPIGTTGTNDLGSSALPWDNVYGVTLYQNGNSVCDITGNCSAATDIWSQANGALFPKNATVDLLVGGTATSSAKFAFMNVLTGTPTASVSAGAAGATYITAGGVIATTAKQSLTIGDTNTGNINFYSPSNVLTSGGNLTLAGTISLPNSNTLTGVSSYLNVSNGIGVGATTGAPTYYINSSGTGNLNALTLAGNLTLNGNVASNVIPSATSTYDLGSTTRYWNNLYVNNVYAPATGISGYWQRNSGALSPTNITDDLLVGGTATSSALFQVFGNTGTATTAGNLVFSATAPTITTTKMAPLTIGNASTGPIQLSPKGTAGLYVDGTGNVGIGTTGPGASLDVVGNILLANGGTIDTRAAGTLGIGTVTQTGLTLGRSGATTTIAGSSVLVSPLSTNGPVYTSGSNGTLNSEQYLALTRGGTNADLSGVATGGVIYKGASALSGTGALSGILQGNGSSAPTAITGTANYLPKWSASAPYLTPTSLLYDDGTNVGVGTTSPLAKLDVAGAASVSGNLTFSGARSIVGTSMNPLTLGDAATGPLQFYSSSNSLTSGGNLTLAGDIAVNGADITTTSTGTATVFNTSATTLNIGGAATTLSLGASTGTTTVNNALTVTGTTTTNGTLTVNSDTITLGNAITDAMTFNARVAQDSDLIPIGTTGTNDLGASTLPWDNLYVDNIISGGQYSGFWQRNAGALAPTNITDDLLVGATATSSALVKLPGISGGNVIFNSGGNVGIGTTSPISLLHVAGQCVTEGTLIRRKRKSKGKRKKGKVSGTGPEPEYEDIPVEDIKIDDEVLTLDEHTGEFIWQKVEDVMDKGYQTVFELTTDDGKSIETTANHPYLVRQLPPRGFGSDIPLEKKEQQGYSNNEQQTEYCSRIENVDKIDLVHASSRAFASHQANSKHTIPLANPRVKSNTSSATEDTLASDGATSVAIKNAFARSTNISDNSFAKVLSIVIEDTVSGAKTRVKMIWKPVADLHIGEEIATIDGWQKIIAITKTGRKHTYDLQIANTHNFVANGIVAHNTTGKALAVFNETGDQAILTASASGTPVFTVGRTGILSLNQNSQINTTGTLLIDSTGTLSVNTTNNQAITTGTGLTTLGGALTVTGATNLNGDTTLGNAITDAMTFNARVAQDSDLIPIGTTGTNDLGASTLPWDNLYVDNIISGGQYSGFWQRNSGVLSPTNITDALLIGLTATPSAATSNYFQVFGTGSTAGDASMSGILTLGTNRTTGIIETERMLPLTLGSSTTGPIQLSPKGTTGLFVDGSGNVGIGNSAPSVALDVTGAGAFSTDLTITGGDITGANGAALDLGEATSGDITITGDVLVADDAFIGLGAAAGRFTFDSTATPDTITVNDANLALGANSLTGTTGNIDLSNFDVVGSSGDITTAGDIAINGNNITSTGDLDINVAGDDITSPDRLTIGSSTAGVGQLTVTGFQVGKALSIFNETGDQNIFTASASGTTVFNLTRTGNLVIGTNIGVSGDTDLLALAANSLTVNGSGTFTSNVTLNAQSELRLADSDSSNYTGFKAPATIGTNIVYTLPAADGSANQVLATNAGGTLSWIDVSGGAGAGDAGYWNQSGGMLFPKNATVDLLIAGTATASAKFQVIATSGNVVTAGTITLPNSAVLTGGTTYLRSATGVAFGTDETYYVNSAGTGNLNGLTLAGDIAINGNNITSTGDLDINVAGDDVTSPDRWTIGSSTAGLAKLTVTGFEVGKALAIFNETGNQDIFTASASGTTRLKLTNAGNLTFNQASTISTAGSANLTLDAGGNLVLADTTVQLSGGSSTLDVYNASADTTLTLANTGGSYLANLSVEGQVLPGSYTVNPTQVGSGAIIYRSDLTQLYYYNGSAWTAIGSGSGGSNWRITSGMMSPLNDTLDVGIGGSATSSAKFAFLNVNTGTPTASVSAGATGATYVTAVGVIATTAKQSLTIGDTNTGNINFYSPSNVLTSAGNLTLAGDLTINGNNITSTGDLDINVDGNDVTSPDRWTIGSSTAGLGKLTVTGFEVGKALTILNETGDQAILAASASGTTRFIVDRSGDIYGQRFVDMADYPGTATYLLDPAATGTSAYLAGGVRTGTGILTSGVADGATATGFTLNTSNSFTTQGAKLLSVQSNATEKFYIDKDGNLYAAGTILSGTGNGVLMTNKSGATVAVRGLVIIDTTTNSSFTTTTTAYAKTAFGVVTGVGLGVTNDANGDGVCNANDICMVAVGGEVNVTASNAATATKGDYLYTSATAGSAVASAKQFDGLIGVVSSTANAASGYLKMIFKVQPQVTASAAIDKGLAHTTYRSLADTYARASETERYTQFENVSKAIDFDTFVDQVKYDSANSTVPIDANKKRVGLYGGRTLNNTNTDTSASPGPHSYLGANDANDVYYYDRTQSGNAGQDSTPSVLVNLGVDPNWYNGVSLVNVATGSGALASAPPPANLSTTYNGSLVKVTGRYAASAEHGYVDVTVRSISTTALTARILSSDWSCDVQSASLSFGTEYSLTAGGCSASTIKITAQKAEYKIGDTFRISSWYLEPQTANDRGPKQAFPERSYLAASDDNLDILDADTTKLWMRFSQGTNYALGAAANNTPSSVHALNGRVYIATNGSSATGLYTLALFRDSVYRTDATDWRSSDKGVIDRNTTNTYSVINTRVILQNVAVNDVHANVVQTATSPSTYKMYTVTADDAALTVIHENDAVAYSYSDVSADDYNAVWLTSGGELYGLNETQSQTEKWNNVHADTASELAGTPDKVWSTAFSATGGTITTSGGYTIHTFTSSGTFTPAIAGDVEYLVVGGGGGGGGSSNGQGGGGGGAGGFRTATGFAVTAQAYTVTVGAGGNAGTGADGGGSNGTQGSSSVFDSITSAGGGYGASTLSANGGSGGSGGGGRATGGGSATPSGQGNAGGTGNGDGSGGGGGASAVGADGVSPNGGNGGSGTASSISGSSVTYAGGGGGGGRPSAGGSCGTGGSGGGGNSGDTGSAGTTNLGGGGGGGCYSTNTVGNVRNGGAGGSGIVIIRYLTSTSIPPALTASAPTIQASSPDALSVTEATSTVNGTSDTLYVTTNQGLSVIQDKAADETNGSVKYYTKDYISEDMIGDVRGAWPLNNANASSDFEDVSVKANNLTGTNVTANGDSVTGVRSTATDLDGSTESLTLADDADLDFAAADTFAVGIWARHNGAIATTEDYLVTKADATTGGYKLYMDASGDYCFAIDDDATWTPDDSACTSAIDYDDSLWHHIVGVKNGTTAIRLYVDGVEVANDTSIAATATLANTNAFYIGVDRDGTSNEWDGGVDEAFVTAENLSAAQIKQIYEVGKRALEGSHATNDFKNNLDEAGTGTGATNVAKAVAVDFNKKYAYIGLDGTGADDGWVSKVDLYSDTQVDQFTTTTDPSLADNDVTSLAVGYDLEAVCTDAIGCRQMSLDSNGNNASGNYVSKTVTTPVSFTQAYLWTNSYIDADDSTSAITVQASNDGGSTYVTGTLTNTDSNQDPSEREYFFQFSSAGSSLKVRLQFARDSTKLPPIYATRWGIAWIGSDAIGGAPGGNGLYTNNNSSVADGSYVEVVHNQNSNDLATGGWRYNTNTAKWEAVDITDNQLATASATVNLNTEANYTQENMAYAVTLTPSATSGDITLTLGSGTWNADARVKAGTRVTGNGGVATITGTPAAQTTIAATTTTNFTNTNAIASGSWYLYGTTFDGSVAKINTYTSSDVGTFSTTSQAQLPDTRRSFSSGTVTIGGTAYLYVLGGYNTQNYSTVYKSTLNSSGNAGTFSTTSQGQLLQEVRDHNVATATIGGTSYIYVIGGITSVAVSTVYKATINTSGDVGTFATTSQGQLPATRYEHRSVTATIGGTTYLYVVGGSVAASTVYKATINSSGDVGTFATTSQGQLPATHSGHGLAVATIGGTAYMYVVGGEAGTSTVYKATINTSGDVGTFATTSQAQLPQTLTDLPNPSIAISTISGTTYMYVVGGNGSGGRVSTVYKATINTSGDVGTFATTSQAQLAAASSHHNVLATTVDSSPYMYLIGGITTSAVSTVYKSSLGGTSAPTSTTYSVVTATDQISTSSWADIDDVDVTETLNSQTIQYAVSFDGRTTFYMYDSTASNNGWRPIARNNSGTWQYNSNTTAGVTNVTWTNATYNSQNGAISQAAGVTQNQMTGTTLGAVTDLQWNEINGFAPTTDTLDFAAALRTTDSSQIPQVDQISVDYTKAGHKIVQQDANTVRLYNYSGAAQNLRLDVITGGLGRNAGTVSLAPAAADVDAQADVNSIWVNKTGTGGNLLRLQTSGTNRFVVSNLGQCVAAGTRIRRRKRRRRRTSNLELGTGPDPNNPSSKLQAPSSVVDDFEDVPVEDIQPGDEVLTLDEQTGDFIWSTVEKTMDKGYQTVYALVTETGKSIRTTAQHPYLALTDAKPAFAFIDEAGVGKAPDQPIFGVAALYTSDSLALNRKLHDIFTGAVSAYHTNESRFEFKFNAVTKNNLRFFKAIVQTLAADDSWSFASVLTKKGKKWNYWNSYLAILPKLIAKAPFAKLTVVADYLAKPKATRHDLETVIKMSKVANLLQLESQGALLLQVADVLLGALHFEARQKELGLTGGKEAKVKLAKLVKALLAKKITAIECLHAVDSNVSQAIPVVKGQKWTQVKDLTEGAVIATLDGWEKIASIERIGRKRTYDLQIVGTHNFVAGHLIEYLDERTWNLELGTWQVILDTYGRGKSKLREAGDLAGGDKIGKADLSVDQEVPRGGKIWSGRSGSKSSRVCTCEYSRRSGQKQQEGIQAVSVDSQRFFAGIRYIDDRCPQHGLHRADGTARYSQASDGTYQENQRSRAELGTQNLELNKSELQSDQAPSSKLQALGTKLQAPSSRRIEFGGIVAHNTTITGSTGNANLILDQTLANRDIFTASNSGTPIFTIGQQGGNAAAILDQRLSGDILTASASGTTRFTVGNSGVVTSSTDNATTNAITDVLTLDHTTSGTAANNIGTGILFRSEDTGGNLENTGRVSGILTTATDGSEISALTFDTRGITRGADVGTFSTTSQGQLPATLNQHSALTATIGGTQYIYAIGGATVSTVYKATIDSSANIGAFSTTSQAQLPQTLVLPEFGAVTASIGGTQYIYVTGGYNGTANVSIVYKATIDSSGNIGTFATTSQAQLPQAQRYHNTVTVTIGGTTYMYVLGGITSPALSTVYKATIDSSGNVGTFSTTSQAQLPGALYYHNTAIATIGGTTYMYVLGGADATYVSTVYKATIDSSGNVGTFSTTSQGQLPQTMYNSSTTIATIGGTQYLYAIGGFNGTYFSTVYKATIDSSGNVGAFATTSQGQLPATRSTHGTVTASIGGTQYVYVTGGSGPVSTVYKATIAGDTGSATLTRRMKLDNTGNLTISGTLTQSGSPDIAENVRVSDESIGAGDVVMIDPSVPSDSLDPYNTFVAKKADTPYSKTILGVISTDPGIVLNSPKNSVNNDTRSQESERPLALSGRVPVKIASSSAALSVGDFLTASDEPGKAMKATKAGTVIGKALENWSCPGPTRPGLVGVCSSTILVFVSLGQSAGELTQEGFLDNGGSEFPFVTEQASVVSEVLGGTTSDPLRGINQVPASTSSGDGLSTNIISPTDSSATPSSSYQSSSESASLSTIKKALLEEGSFESVESPNSGPPGSSNWSTCIVSGISDLSSMLWSRRRDLHPYLQFDEKGSPLHDLRRQANPRACSIIAQAKEYVKENWDSLSKQNVDIVKSLWVKTTLLTADVLDIGRIGRIGRIETSVISPIASDSAGIAVQLGASQRLSLWNKDSLSPQPVASFDAQGNATFSGTLYADRIVTRFGDFDLVRTATLAATTSANSGVSLGAELDATSSALLALLAAERLSLEKDSLSPQAVTAYDATDAVTLSGNLSVLGDTTLGRTSIAGSLLVDGAVRITKDGIETIGDTLYLQKNRFAGLDVMNGALIVDTLGNVAIKGDLAVGGNLTVGGTLSASTISPLGDDFVIDLSRPSEASSSVIPAQAGIQTGSPIGVGDDSQRVTFGRFLIRGTNGLAVATIDASGSASFRGDLVASGSGTFNKLFIASPEASTSGVSFGSPEVSTNTSIGTGVLPAGTTEQTIATDKVTQKSFIYITPIGTTSNRVLYLKSQTPGSGFVVALDQPVNHDIRFNWWIVN